MGASVTSLLEVPSLRLGRYRCPPSGDEWVTENDIGPRAHVVFPERPVAVTRAATGPQLADRNWALLFRPGQLYRLGLVDPEGDECTFVELSPRLYGELLGRASATTAFDAGRVLVDDPAWLGFQECLVAPVADPDAVERRLQEVLHTVVGAQTGPADRVTEVPGPSTGTAREQDHRVHAACRILATRLEERLTLPAVAEAVGLSTYHFCRLFRATTGLTVHAYRTRLRLRAAFSGCAARPDGKLSDLAMSVGYASHSHMTTDFRAALAMTPSGVRDRYARGTAAAGVFNLR